MNAKEAKELSLEVWEYLKDNPEIDRKCKLPVHIYFKIVEFRNECPLCEYSLSCLSCPLKSCKGNTNYCEWHDATTDDERKEYATKIYEAINNWDITKLD